MNSARVEPKMVSVIIPSYNEAKNISRCLNSIFRQSYKNIEVILVDDASTDNTVSIAQGNTTNFKKTLKVISQKNHQERGVTRNAGAKIAKGKYLLFIDADMELNENVVSECLKKIDSDSQVKAVIIPEQSKGEGFWAKCRILEKRCYLGDNRIEAARFFETQSFWK